MTASGEKPWDKHLAANLNALHDDNAMLHEALSTIEYWCRADVANARQNVIDRIGGHAREVLASVGEDRPSRDPEWREIESLRGQLVAAQQLLAEADWALRRYAEWYSGNPFHTQDDCPEDDTCSCPDAERLSRLFAVLSASPASRPFDKLGADRLADEVAVLVRRGILDSRSPAADALLDYRDPPSTPRADRLAALEDAEREREGQLVAAQRERDEALADLTDVKKVRSALDDLGATVKMLEQINALRAQLVAAQEALAKIHAIARGDRSDDYENDVEAAADIEAIARAALAAPPRAPQPPTEETK